jgi:hypothetical protein
MANLPVACGVQARKTPNVALTELLRRTSTDVRERETFNVFLHLKCVCNMLFLLNLTMILQKY